MIRYVVAATPRTGSSLLCEGLAATGVAGRPEEPFAPDFMDRWRFELGVPRAAGFAGYLQAVLARGTGADGVFGTKIQWMHVDPLAAVAGVAGPPGEALVRLFPGARYLNIVRRDRRAQALSWFRANHTHEWWRLRPGRRHAPPRLDPREVRALEAEIARQQDAWLRYFADRGITALTVAYEDLVAAYRPEVARALDFLGRPAFAAAGIPGPRLLRQADEITDMWRRAMDGEEAVPDGPVAAQHRRA